MNAILTEILASAAISSELKRYLARNLRKIIIHIDEYTLTRALPLLEGVEATIGHVAGDAEYKTFLTDTALGQRLAEVLAAMANLVTVAVGVLS